MYRTWFCPDGCVGATDVGREVRGLPEVFPVVAEETAVRPMSWPVVVETEPQVGCESDGLLSEREVVDIADISLDVCRTRFR